MPGDLLGHMSFKNRDKAKQLIDYKNLQYGKIHPTDIDGLIEYHNIARVYFEFKYKDSPIPMGQQIALERLVDDARMAKKEAVLFLCSHSVPMEEDIDAADAKVTAVYWNGKWRPGNNETVKSWVDRFLTWVDAMARG